MRFKDIYYLELWQPSCSAEWNHLCNLGIMRNNCVKLFKIWASGSGGNAFKKISYLEL